MAHDARFTQKFPILPYPVAILAVFKLLLDKASGKHNLEHQANRLKMPSIQSSRMSYWNAARRGGPMRPANYLGSILLILFLSASLAAQGRPSGRGTGGTGGRPASGNTPSGMPTTNIPPNINNPSTNLPPMLFMSGKVAVDDGSELTDSAMIESVCNGDRHFEAYTDRKGNFSFQFGQQRDIGAGDVATTDANVPGRSMTPQQQQRQLQQCELVAVLPGFTSQTVELSGTEVSESMNVGTIVLHRMAHVEGFTLSATTAM